MDVGAAVGAGDNDPSFEACWEFSAMKWTFLNRRSGVQKLPTRDSPLSGARFDPSNSDAMCDDNAEATTQIVYKQLLGQMEPMNVVDEEAHDTSSRDRTAPAFKGADDTAHQPLTSS